MRQAKVSPSPAYRAGREKRSRLLDAAVPIFRQRGINGASLADIAVRADAVPSQITYYFGTKEALFVEAACRELLYLAADAERASSQETSEAQYVETMVRSVVAASGLKLFIEALSVVRQRPQLGSLVEETIERLDVESARALQEFLSRSGQPANTNNGMPARRFWVVAIGMAVRGMATNESTESLTSEMLKILRLDAAG